MAAHEDKAAGKMAEPTEERIASNKSSLESEEELNLQDLFWDKGQDRRLVLEIRTRYSVLPVCNL